LKTSENYCKCDERSIIVIKSSFPINWISLTIYIVRLPLYIYIYMHAGYVGRTCRGRGETSPSDFQWVCVQWDGIWSATMVSCIAATMRESCKPHGSKYIRPWRLFSFFSFLFSLSSITIIYIYISPHKLQAYIQI